GLINALQSGRLARFLVWLVRLNASVFEGVECRSGFLDAPRILEQSHQTQSQDSGIEAVTHLVSELVVNCELGSVSFRNASNVSGKYLLAGPPGQNKHGKPP